MRQVRTVPRFKMTGCHHFSRRIAAIMCGLRACLLVTQIALGSPSPAQSEIPKLVADAATFQAGQSRQAFDRLQELRRQAISDSALRESLEAGLVKLLGPGSTFEARRFACKELGIIGGKSALPAIAILLKSNDAASLACLALTTYPPGKADDVLRSALPSAQGTARIQIINTLGDRRDTRSTTLLAQAARDSDSAVAAAAIAALGKMGDKTACDAIVSLRRTVPASLSTTIAEASLQCAAGLAAAGDRKAAVAAYEDLLGASEPPYVRRAAFSGLLRLDKDDGEMRAYQTIRGSDAVLKPVAIGVVRSLPSRDASAKFAGLLSQLPPQEQAWLIESLAVRGDVPARNAIASSLASSDPIVRRAAISALGRIGDASTVGLFARTLAASSDADERRAIEAALVALNGGNQIDEAVVVELKKVSGDARASLISVLARRQGSAANIVLFQETTNANPVIAKAAFRGLANTTAAPDVPALLQGVVGARDSEIREEAENAASQALGKMDDASDRSTLVREALRTAPSIDVISALLILLPRCGDPHALALLQAAQSDSNAQVRDAAIHALADWPDDSAWESLSAIYRRPANETVRRLALHGLVRLASDENAHPSRKLIEHYRELLDSAHDEPDLLRPILGALGSSSDPDALQLAYPYLEKESVRPEAEAAVKKIAESVKAKNPDAAARGARKNPAGAQITRLVATSRFEVFQSACLRFGRA